MTELYFAQIREHWRGGGELGEMLVTLRLAFIG